jgi:hypothetical protein
MLIPDPGPGPQCSTVPEWTVIRIQHITLMRIRIRLPKIFQTYNTVQYCAFELLSKLRTYLVYPHAKSRSISLLRLII